MLVCNKAMRTAVAVLELLSGFQMEKRTPNPKKIMNKNYTVSWREASFPLIAHGPIRLYLLKEPLYVAHENISLGREVQWSWNSWFVLQLSSVRAKYNFFPDNAANGVIIYTTRLFQKHVHRSSLNNHSLKINQTAGTSEWAVQEECMSDGQTDSPRNSRKQWEGDGWTNNRNKNLDEPSDLINPPSPFSPPPPSISQCQERCIWID